MIYMAHRPPRRAKSLKRSAAGREMYDRVLIVCEGTKTEPAYFNEIRNKLELSTANVEVTPADGSDPMSIVRYAKDLQNISARQGNRYDHIYCVFDRDQHEEFQNAYLQLNTHTRSQFKSACSWPCFEFWLILHFKYQRKPFSDTQNRSASQNCESILRKHLHDYTKGMAGIFEKLYPKTEFAIENAKRAMKDAEQTDDKNPSTEVHNLVEYLQNLKII